MPSRLSPFGSGMQARVDGQSSVYAAGVRLPPSVKVELPGFAKSAWKRHTRQIAFSPDIRNGSGAPAGGGVEPSRSAGSIASLELVYTLFPMYLMKVAVGLPASIAARSNANGIGPR